MRWAGLHILDSPVAPGRQSPACCPAIGTANSAGALSLTTLLEMLRFHAHLFCGLTGALLEVRVATANMPPDAHLSEDARAYLTDHLKTLAGQHDNWQALPVSLAALRRLLGALTMNASVSTLRERAATLDVVLQDELGAVNLWQVPSDKVLFLKSNSFGEDVAFLFPSAARDIEEAGKCLAFGRSTACVFHLMRVVEFGLNAVAGSLKIKMDSNPTWQKILNEINGAVNKKGKRWRRRHEEYYAGVVMTLSAIKTAVRNPTMHIRGRYGTDEAEDIFLLTRSLMQHIVKHCHETETKS